MPEPSKKAIYGTDLSKPIDEILEGVRNQITHARGQLSDVGFAFSGYRERMAEVEGLLTCGLIALAYYQDEYRKYAAERARK